MSERAPVTNFKFGFNLAEQVDYESDIKIYSTDEAESTIVTDVQKAEVMAYAGRRFEEAAVLNRKLAKEALMRIGDAPKRNKDLAYYEYEGQYNVFDSQHYAYLAVESAQNASQVYDNVETMYDMIEASKTTGPEPEDDEDLEEVTLMKGLAEHMLEMSEEHEQEDEYAAEYEEEAGV